jgi:hypothetical protein
MTGRRPAQTAVRRGLRFQVAYRAGKVPAIPRPQLDQRMYRASRQCLWGRVHQHRGGPLRSPDAAYAARRERWRKYPFASIDISSSRQSCVPSRQAKA